MITRKELNPHGYHETEDIKTNLDKLLSSINVIRKLWGKPMIVTSGLRSKEDQMRINPAAPHSKHLLGAACDIADGDGSLQAWCLANEANLAVYGLWCENFSRTPHWVHFQCLPPASGKRFFWP